MKRMRLSEIIAAVDGSPAAASTDDPAITGVCTDSRKVDPGELFVPLCGEHHDGHDFIAGAFERGAAASLSSRDASAGSGRRIVKVSDTLTALEDLALYNRGELSFEVTAITGSVGKTTTKEFLKHILGTDFTVAAAPKSFNNRLGVALTLLETDEDTEHLVVEMGTSGKGELSYLSKRVRPERIIITTVAPAHLEGLEDLPGIIAAKAEIFEGLDPAGRAYLNPAAPGYEEFRACLDGEPRTYGTVGADFPLELSPAAGGAQVGYRFRDGAEEYTLELPGEHNVTNAGGAIAVALDLGVSPASIREGLARCRLPPGRLNVWTEAGVHFVDDSYNANPCSMKAALDTFEEYCAGITEGRNIAVLGEMLELGPRSRHYHAEIGSLLAGKPVDLLVTIRGSSRYLGEAFTRERESRGRRGDAKTMHFEELSPAREYLSEEIRSGDKLLFKASNAVGLSGLAEELRETVGAGKRELPLV